MHCNNWIFDMDGTLTDSMTVVWEGAPDALLARYGRTPKSDLHKTLLTMGMADGAAYLIREYDLPLKMEDYNDVMWDVITKLYETVELKPGVRELLARLKAEGARMCICSNTWSAQCRTVLTRLGIDEYFDFYVEAQGALHKSRPDVFFQTLTRLGGTDPDRCVVCEDSLYAARTAHDAGFHVIGIADALGNTGLTSLVGETVAKMLGTNVNPFVLIFAFCILTSVLATLTGSTIGTVYVFAPMAIATCVNLGLDPTAAAAAIVVSGWCGHFLPIDGMPAMIMGAGDYKITEFWKFTIPQYFIRLLALTVGAVLIFPMK